jgi:branched-subunit amino acid transport protein
MMSGIETLVAIGGLALITVVTRGFFMIPERQIPIPRWLREALRFAPLAALVAVLVPEIAMTADGHLIHTWKDARLFAAAAGALWFWVQRGLLGTILAGTAVLLVLRLGLGW